METLQGDILTWQEMQQRDIVMIQSEERGGCEFRTRESMNTLAMHLLNTGWIEEYHYNEACILLDMYRAWMINIGVKWGHAIIELGSLDLSPGEALKRYGDIRQILGVKRAAKIIPMMYQAMTSAYLESDIDSPDDEENKIPAMVKHEYKIIFEEISNAMSEERKLRNKKTLV